MNRIKRICALLLAIVLILGVVLQPGIGGVLAKKTEQTGQNTEATTEPTTETLMEKPAEPPTEVMMEPTMETLMDAPTEPITEVTMESATEPTTETLMEPITEPATESATEAMTEPTTEVTMEPTTESAMEPATELTTELPKESAMEPATEPPTESPTESAMEPETEVPTEPATEPPREPEAFDASAEESEYIYFDLAAGNVTINDKTKYTGYIYVAGKIETVTGEHKAENKYYVYQSNLTDASSPGYYMKTGYASEPDFEYKTNCRVPIYDRVKKGITPWTDYVTNNTDVKAVSNDWAKAAADSGRTATNNYITFASESNYTADVTIDNIWSAYHHASVNRTTGGIGAHLDNKKNTSVCLRLRGDNRVGCVHYSADKGDGNIIEFNNGETGDTPGSITVADFSDNFKANHWNSAIGAADNPPNTGDMSDGIVINSGVIYAGTTPEDNCTAIGGGGNNYGGITINGGTVTAVVSSTGTAIGGGIGYGNAGGNTDVVITDGTIYAYNLGIEKGKGDGFTNFIPAAAIGGGGSKNAAGSLKTTIKITGGNVYAQSMGGAAIGGGCSANALGGPATIDISGGTIIAKSTGGKYGTETIQPGVSIGGGTGKTGGGSVTLNIDGGILRTGSIGGGKTTGTGNIGSANVTITDGDIIGQVIMAGGAAKSCSFDMSGGMIHKTDLIHGNTIEGTDLEDPRVDVPIQYVEKNGGAVWMDDPKGVTRIIGGTIENCSARSGGAIYMTGGTFTMSGGTISNNAAHKDDSIDNGTADSNGGGVYVGGGKVNVSGGTISNNTADSNGGGMYVGGGDVDVTGGTISNNTAAQNGGGIYVAGNYSMTDGEVISNQSINGGGIYVNNGIVTMYGGKVDSNTAATSGGGMYVSSADTAKPAIVDIFSGSISSNRSKSGGGVAVISDSGQDIRVTLGVDCVHPDLPNGQASEEGYTPFSYPDNAEDCGRAHIGHTNHINGLTHSSCPHVIGNVASDNGGGFYFKSEKTYLVFYCVIEKGNVAQGNSQCYSMDVEGGHVVIGDSTYDYKEDAPVKGNIIMSSSILVNGGMVDIYGTMYNPKFTDDITVDIKESDDYYIDHRLTKQEPLEFYKVHYYENFKGDGDTPTGLYIARQYPDLDHDSSIGDKKFDFTIMSSIFSHPGYKIVGWNTKPDDTGDKYEVNETYNLKELDNNDKVGATISKGTTELFYDQSLLVIYAIWERFSYVLHFDPNVGAGETYTGTMQNQRVSVGVLDGSQKISENQFKRHGYEFVGWTLTSAPSDADTKYGDGEAITKDFTNVDGATVTLYAQWKPCTHEHFLVYDAEGNVLTESCSNCGGHTATATILAVDCDYDGHTHLATKNFSSNWLGEKPEISYEMAPNAEWDSQDTADEEWAASDNPQPLHAGNYTAKLTVDGVTAQTEYTIRRIKWDTPEVPKIKFTVATEGAGKQESIVEITAPVDNNIEYLITLLDFSNNTETPVGGSGWQKSREFPNISFGYYYYFYARRCADRDHLESDSSRSEAYLADGENIVYIEKDTGIKVVPNIGGGTFTYTVSADEGYHLRGYNDNYLQAVEKAALIPGAPENALKNKEEGINVSRNEPSNDGGYTYTVTFDINKVTYHQLTLTFSGAVKNASIAYKVTDGEVFSDFNGKTTSISCDSAFTAQFTVNDYIPDEYTEQKLSFLEELPAGSTIIMKADGGYWYYKADTEMKSIDLTSFTAMGGTALFTFDKDSDSGKAFTYQFIVDFSRVKKEDYIAQENLTVSLDLTAGEPRSDTSQKAPDIPAAGDTHISLGIKKEASFGLAAVEPGVTGKSATLTCTYIPSAGAASIWNGRKTALVLTAPSTVPSDLTLTAVVAGNTTRYTMNSKRQFIIPLGGIGAEDVTEEIKVTLNSHLFGLSEDNLMFAADWYVSQSSADQSPLNGYKPASCSVSFSSEKDPVPSVRIDGNAHRCEAGGKLEVTVNYAGIPAKASVTAYLQRKAEGRYLYSGASVDVIHHTDTSEQPRAGEKAISFNMGQMAKGSYRVLVIVEESDAYILQVPYYFIIE